MAYNKINYGGTTLIDLTDAHPAQADVLAGVEFYGDDGEKHEGSMTDRGAVSGTISARDGSYTVQKGYHNGSGSVSISSVERAKIVPENIKKNVVILGQTGSYEGEAASYQTLTKNYTPSSTAQSETITAGTGYDAIGQITVNVSAIPYEEVSNTYGTTVNIG